MITRCCVVLLYLVMEISEVSLQVTVKGVIGDSVILPCSSKESQLTVEDITVNWKHHDRLKVYDIVNGKGSVEGQYTAYNNRVESFPEQYVRGNLSLILNKLQYNDKGKYQCYIIKEAVIQSVELHIEEPQQAVTEHSVGSSAVLPCRSRQSQLTPEDITVYWRRNDTLKVYDIIKGRISLDKQDLAYENRTEIISENYLKGNFSLKLNDLQRNDTGTYTCHITNELRIQSVKLEVNQGAQASKEKILLVPFLAVFILFCM